MAKIIWTDEAERWLKDIHDYIAADNPTAAFTVVEGIYERAQILSNFPEIGYKYRSEPMPLPSAPLRENHGHETDRFAAAQPRVTHQINRRQ